MGILTFSEATRIYACHNVPNRNPALSHPELASRWKKQGKKWGDLLNSLLGLSVVHASPLHQVVFYMFVVSYLYVGLVNVNEIWTGDVSTIVVLQMKVEAILIGTFLCNDVITSIIHSSLLLHVGASYKPESWWKSSTVIALNFCAPDF